MDTQTATAEDAGAELAPKTRLRLHTGGTLIEDNLLSPGWFIITNNDGIPVDLPASYVSDVVAFMRKHGKKDPKRRARRLPLLSRLSRHEYIESSMDQECPSCGWRSLGARLEFETCCVCGAGLSGADCSLVFDVMSIRTWRQGFILTNDPLNDCGDEGVKVWHADADEVAECLQSALAAPVDAGDGCECGGIPFFLATFAAVIMMVAPIMLLIALLPMPNGYYRVLRWVVCITAGALAVCFPGQKGTPRSRWTFFTLVSVAVVFTPFNPIHMPRGIWACVDIATAALFLFIPAYARRCQTASRQG